jgi:hypothetical protein
MWVIESWLAPCGVFVVGEQEWHGPASVDGGCALAATVGSTEEMVLAAQSDGAERPLSGGVVDLDAALIDVSCERTPARERLANGLCRL